MKAQLTNPELIFLCSQLSMLLRAGISLLEAVSILKEDAPTKEGGEILSVVHDRLLETGNIQDALEHAEVFPSYLIHLVEIGDLSGNLDNTFASLASHYQREENLKKSIRDSLTYPLIMLGMLFAVLLVLILKVMPVFSQVFSELGAEMSAFSLGILNLGTVLRRYSLVFLLILFLFAAMLLFLTCSPKGKLQFSALFQKLPFTRDLLEKIACGRFASGMSMALHSGLDIEQSFDLVSRLVEHPGFQKKIVLAREAIQNGDDFAGSLTRAGIFQGIDARMISIGFHTGSVEQVLEQIALRLTEESEEKLQRFVGILEPSLVALLSIFVGLILLSVMLPLVGVMSHIG